MHTCTFLECGAQSILAGISTDVGGEAAAHVEFVPSVAGKAVTIFLTPCAAEIVDLGADIFLVEVESEGALDAGVVGPGSAAGIFRCGIVSEEAAAIHKYITFIAILAHFHV